MGNSIIITSTTFTFATAFDFGAIDFKAPVSSNSTVISTPATAKLAERELEEIEIPACTLNAIPRCGLSARRNCSHRGSCKS